MDSVAQLRSSLPAGLSARPPVLADAEAATEIANRQSRHLVGVDDASVDRTLTWWQEPTRDLSRDSLLVTDGDGAVLAWIDYSEYEPFDQNEYDLVIDPSWGDRGIEEALLRWVENRAQESIENAPTGSAITLETSVWAENTVHLERLLRRGYVTTRYWDRMEITFEAPPKRPDPPAGVSIRTARADEIDAIHAAWEDAQQDEFGFVGLSDEQFRYYFVSAEPGFDPSLWFLAIDDTSDEIIGYALGRMERPGDPDCSQIRYVAVRRAWRRKGIASALLGWSFADFYQRGRRRVSLAVDSESLTGAHRLYERVGMRPTLRSVTMILTLRPGDASGQPEAARSG